MKPYHDSGDGIVIYNGDCREVSPLIGLVDAVVCDPPYGLSFMGKGWDHGVPGVEYWKIILNACKPGAHLVAFGGTRTFHRLACAIEDAGFEIRDTLMWVYGSGFPKSLDVSKAIDKCGGENVAWFGEWLRQHRAKIGISQKELAERGGFFDKVNHGGLVANWELGYGIPTAGQFNKVCELLNLPFTRIEEVEREVIGRRRVNKGVAFTSEGPEFLDVTKPACDPAKQWDGYGTALKPAWEPVILARKPIEGTVAANVLKYGCGAINIDGCRVEFASETDKDQAKPQGRATTKANGAAAATPDAGRNIERIDFPIKQSALGRWPANLIHDGSQMVMELFPQSKGQQGDVKGTELSHTGDENGNCYGVYGSIPQPKRNDSGSAARFFYCAKAAKSERGEENKHPTVKPLALMQYLCRLVTPMNGIVLDPFMGSGSTLIAARNEGFKAIGIDLEEKYCETAVKRMCVNV